MTDLPTGINPTADPIASILEKIDGRIDARMEAERAELREYLQSRDDHINDVLNNLSWTMAEMVAGNELGMTERWREFVVSEARRMQVRPSEIIGQGGAE